MNEAENTAIQKFAQDSTPAPTLEVLTLEVKFYLNQTAQNIIEVGKRLNQAKELVPHGEWGKWLEDNFSLSQNTANKFMNVAKRFSNYSTSNNLNSSQMVELLALPAEETEQFIEAKAAEGKPVEDMTIRQMREEIEQWKSIAEVNENALNAKQRELEDASRKVGKIAQDFNNLQFEKKSLERRLDDAQKRLTERYEQETRELAKLRNEKAALQKKLDAAPRTVEVLPQDYQTTKKRLSELDTKIAAMQKQIDEQVSAEDYANVAQKLDAIYALITDIGNSPNAGRVVADYERNNPERYARLCAKFSDFIRIMEME